MLKADMLEINTSITGRGRMIRVMAKLKLD